jgi:redox-sensitive bicupin YhaK (pirin superfamily)
MPKGDSRGAMYGFQLWANLPAANKMMEPRYRGLASADIPTVNDAGGAVVRVIAGRVGGVEGPVRDVVTHPEYLDVSIGATKTFSHATPRGHTVFAYVFAGKGVFGEPEAGQHERLIGDRQLVHFGDGDLVSVAAEAEPVRFLLISGEPIREPIAWQGPIVMNTQAELREAFEELEKNTFIKHERKARH